MNWLASFLIVIALTWVGHEYANHLAYRPKVLRLWKNALQILEAEIVYSHATIRDALQSVSRQVPAPLTILLNNIANDIHQDKEQLFPIWEKHINEFYQKHFIQSDDREILFQFGRTLGQHDILQQQKYIRLTITHLERNLAEADERNHRYGKVSRSIGFLFGLLVVLLLL